MSPFLRCGCGATWPCAEHEEGAVLIQPMDAWVAHARRAGWINKEGIATDRHGANVAFNAYAAGWNDAMRAAGVAQPATKAQQNRMMHTHEPE